MKTKKLTLMSLLLTAALIIFVVEAHIPPPVPIAGVKIGLANIITLAALVWLGKKEALAILTLRIILGNIFGGQAISLLYSLAGGLLCFAVMAALFPLFGRERLWIVSVFGAIAHNTGQICTAWALIGSGAWLYFPVLLASGIITGAFTGLTAQLIVKRIERL